jgi:predicted RNA binding protein YcfA (HicA-like mRNA interferase family)
MVRSISRRELVRRFRDLGFAGPISGGRHQFMKKGALKVRIPNPHTSGTIDGSLVKEILGQAGIEIAQWEKAGGTDATKPGS